MSNPGAGLLTMATSKNTFGDQLRTTRVDKGYSLRKFAQLIDVSPTYLSQVEQGNVKTPPTADRVEKMAKLLGADVDEWVTLAGRVSKESEEILQSNPELPALLRAVKGLTPEQIKQLAEEAERKKNSGGTK
jgi:transcriptional regulator with XRE-family HTH domain